MKMRALPSYLIVLLLVLSLLNSSPYLHETLDQHSSSEINQELRISEELQNYMDTGVSNQESSMDRILVISKSNLPLIESIYPRVKVGGNFMHFVNMPSQIQLRAIYLNQDVISIMPDHLITSQSEKKIKDETLNGFVAKDIMDLERVWQEFNITGDGVIIGIVDTGVDFGNSDLEDSALMLSDGFTASFDPTGDGIETTNLTLTAYNSGAQKFLPLEGKMIYGRNGIRNIYQSNLDYGIELKDLEVTGLAKVPISNNYKVGMIIQESLQEGLPVQVFIYVLIDANILGVYDTVYVDLDTSLALTLTYNGLIFESGSTFLSLVDWSLTDEEYFDKNNPIIARDVDGDGVNDVSAGALATALNQDPDISNQIYIRGIDPLGKAIVLMYDVVGHGTLSAGAAAANGEVLYPIYDDQTTEIIENATGYALPGSAPNAKIIATKGLTVSDYALGWFWLAGLEFSLAGNLEIVDADHRSDIISNSWGDTAITTIEAPIGLDIYSMLLDLMTVPEDLYDGYPGMVFVSAAGNGGSGYGTVATPGAASLSITVGASNNFAFLQNAGKNDIAWFSGRGPTTYGNTKPDVVAPGNIGYTIHSVIAGKGNGTYAGGTFGGTSESTPRVAGVVALIIQALRLQALPTDIGKVRTILKSTTQDLGYHQTLQGAGLVNAYNAVSAVFDGPELIVSSNTTAKTLGPRLQDTFKWYFDIDHPYTTELIPDTTIITDGNSLADNVEIDIQYGNGTNVNISTISILAKQLVQIDSTTFDFSSISAEVTSINLDAKLPFGYKSAELLQISLSLDELSWENLLSSGLITPEMVLVDSNTNNIIYNIITQRSWLQQIYSGKPGADFTGEPYLRFTDRGYTESVYGWTGLHYQAYAQIFDYEDLGLTVTKGNDSFVLNGTIDTSRFGSIFVGNQRIPMYITQIESVGYADQAGFVDVYDDFEVPHNWDEAYGTLDWGYRPESGDFRFFQFNVTANATYFVIQASWDNNETLPDLFLFNGTSTLVATSEFEYIGGGFYQSESSELNKQNLIVKADPGIYTLVVHFTQMPFEATPASFQIFSRYLTINEIPSPVVSYSQDILFPFTGIIDIFVENYTVQEFPELIVSGLELGVVKGRNETIQSVILQEDQIKGTAENLDFIEGTFLMEFDEGERVDIVLSWPDLVDFDIYVLDSQGSLDLSQDLLEGQGTSPGIDFEKVSFAAPHSGFYLILIDFILADSVMDLPYTLHIDSRKGPVLKSSSDSISIPTQIFPDNEYEFQITYITNFDLEFESHSNVMFENHQDFTSSLLAPSDGETVSGDVFVSWEASVFVVAEISLFIDGISVILNNQISTTEFSFDSTLYRNGFVDLVVKLSDGIFSHKHSIILNFDNDDISTLPPLISDGNSVYFEAIWVFSIIVLIPLKKKSKAIIIDN